ncbi:hypothetical protein HIM_09906 [Hirsutella minnesotensis 3608]|uniref:DDE-1 domain-containing protein n=1 Tax=Hirsutella minnesotensis 3608 TaxID=1043627 RepID=A0A0F7ZXH3_9HYPO|nr:hypothetical protein HIM_09906 [Hirsutella minnesotensis 3608]
MATSAANQSILYERRVDLAVQAIQASQVPSIRAAATLYDVSRATLQRRLAGRAARRVAQVNNRKLTATEEQALLDRIISLDGRKKQASTVTQTKRRKQKTVRDHFQPGDRTWVTVIEGVNATGWALPSTIIFEGKVHQSTWYRTGIPRNWVIGVSKNGWTNNNIGFKWLTEVFDKHSRHRVVGKYRLLLLDGHGSHFTPEFDDFCKKNSIVWLCYPPHSTHLLQALDFGCFSALKSSYGRLVQEKAELETFHIDKIDF